MGARSLGTTRTLRGLLAFAAVVGTLLVAAPVASADNDSINDPFFLESDYAWFIDDYTAANYGEEPADEPGTADGEDVGCPFLMEHTTWWEFQGTGGDMTITTAEDRDLTTNIDSQMAVYVRNSQGALEPVDCVDDPRTNVLGAEVSLSTEFRRRYFVQVGRVDTDNTSSTADDVLEIVALADDEPNNDNRANALEVASGPDETYENLGATLEDNEGSACGLDFNKTVWFKYTLPDQGSVEIDLSSPFFNNALLVLYDGNSGTPLQCDTALPSGFEYEIKTDNMSPRTLLIQVGAVLDDDDPEADNWDPDEGLFGLQLVFTVDPDYDKDGVPNGSDRCPRTAGTGLVKDCPDPDSDGFADGIDDRCPGLGGRNAQAYQGCPDEDNDGVPEGPGGRDACPGANPQQLGRRDRTSDGCPDTLQVHKLVRLRRSVVFADGRGVRLLDFAVTGVPAGARVVIICKRPNGRRCGGTTVRRASVLAQAAKTVRPRNLQGDVVPFGTKITTRVTAPYATGSFIRWTAARNSQGFREKRFCMNSGSRKLRPIRRGCR